ncbi:unnamed protein product [Toxocara canis]|uniref:ALMS_motif domain-containing protein n=1 Tax=Toxocara canis TaxID=6265 RepID=A0A183UP65_TOXCA|nr:unnamed protein product [Toxocara canis]
MALSSNRLFLEKEAVSGSQTSCIEGPTCSRSQEYSSNGTDSAVACRTSNAVGVREKDKERKRITRLKMRGGVNDYSLATSRGWPSGLDLLREAAGRSIIGSNSLNSFPDSLNGWSAGEDIRREPSLTVQEYLIGQTLTAEAEVKSSNGAKLHTDLSSVGNVLSVGENLRPKSKNAAHIPNWRKVGGVEASEDVDLKCNEMVIRMSPDMMAHTQPLHTFPPNYANIFSPTSQSDSFCLPEEVVLTAKQSLPARDESTMLGEVAVPLVLTKMPGYEIINVAVNCESGKRDEVLQAETDINSHCLRSVEPSGKVGRTSDGRIDGSAIKTDENIDKVTVRRCEEVVDGNKDEAIKELRRRQRSRSVLPPEKLAYIRAVDAERKRIARTRVRLLEMTADSRNGNSKRRRLLKHRKHPISVEDAVKFGWPNLNDERKERAVLEKRLEKYRVIIEKLIEAEKQTSGGLMPLEVLRAMVIEQAKLFTFLTQRNDLRRNQVELVDSDEAEDRLSSCTASATEASMASATESTPKEPRITLSDESATINAGKEESMGWVAVGQGLGVGCRRRSSTEGYKALQSKHQASEMSKVELKSDVAGLTVVPHVPTKVPLKVRRVRRKPLRRSSLSDEELAMRRAIEAARKRIWRAKRRAEHVASEGDCR